MSAKKKTPSGQKGTGAGTADPASLALITARTRTLLAYHRELGIAVYPAAARLHRVDSGKRKKTPVQAEATFRQPAQPTPAQDPSPARKSDLSTTEELQNISRDLKGCRVCGTASPAPRPGSGSEAPRLFVVGDYCSSRGLEEGLIWGQEEDELFWKMMAAIGLDRESVYVTNCIKCAGEADSPNGSGKQCYNFLERELVLLEPSLICVMGDTAARQLLSSNQPLVRLRGRFHEYRFPHGAMARVMPTFHPRFLLQHPEMKRATWMDLQALQRQMDSGR